MTERDRLLELLDDYGECDLSLCDVCDGPMDDCLACKNEQLADYLIANGVIMLPCKVGNTIYFDTYKRGESIGIQPHKVANISIVVSTERPFGCVGADIYDWEFGKTVFLSREEAERELERRKE